MKTKKVTLISPEELFGEISQLLQDGLDAEFTVVGNSMWPFLVSKRDKVTLRKAEIGSLKKGDIVLFKTEDRYILHRITKLKNARVQTTGDSNCYRDNFVSVENILGLVVSFTRKGKQISCNNVLYKFISTVWRVLFPVRPALLRFLFLLRRRAR